METLPCYPTELSAKVQISWSHRYQEPKMWLNKARAKKLNLILINFSLKRGLVADIQNNFRRKLGPKATPVNGNYFKIILKYGLNQCYYHVFIESCV